MAVDHGLLHAVQFALVLEVFNRDQLFAVQAGNEGQAGVEGAITHALAIQLTDHHGAGTAVARGAAFFGSGFAYMLTQVIEHGDVWVEGMLSTQLPVE